jgi:GntR family transcriptional regulator
MTGSALYRKVAEDIKAAIAAGTYPANTKLPSESELAERYSVSRGTIRQAFAALRADGVIASRRGARRIVVGGPRVQSFGELLSFSRWARAIGEVPAGRVMTLERRPAIAAEAQRLGLPHDAHVYYLVRVRLLSGRPVMIERAVYPDRVGVLVAGLDLAHDSITERLEELGVVFTDAEHVIDAVAASAEDARWLGVRAGVPLLRERRFTTDRAGQPVEWSDDRYLGSATAFSVRNSVAVNALSRTSAAPDQLSERKVGVRSPWPGAPPPSTGRRFSAPDGGSGSARCYPVPPGNRAAPPTSPPHPNPLPQVGYTSFDMSILVVRDWSSSR